MSLSADKIKLAKSDRELFQLLSDELQRRLPKSVHEDRDALCVAMRALPPGLRAMAATHRLDVSMAMDDLGWHFANFFHPGLCDETELGLRELEAIEVVGIFQQARMEFERHWQMAGAGSLESLSRFKDWYAPSGLEAALDLLNRRLWEICSESPDYGLMQFWLNYARKYPGNLVDPT